MDTGRELRDVGVERVKGKDDEFHEHALLLILGLAADGVEFTADDVRQRLLLQPKHPNSMGAAFISARRKGYIDRVGYQQSTVASTHARVTGVYVGSRRTTGHATTA